MMLRKLNREFAIGKLQFAIFLYALLTLPLSAAPPQPTQAVSIDGESFPGRIIQIDASGKAILQGEREKRAISLDDLVSWGVCPEPRRGPVLVLANGGLLPADLVAADKDTLQVESERFGPLKIPLEILAGMVFRLPNTVAGQDDLLERLLHASGDGDRLILDNGDVLSGFWEALRKNAVEWRNESGTTSVAVARLSAVVFNPALRRKPAPNPRAWTGFDDGSRLPVERIGMEAGTVQIVVSGLTWKTAANHLTFLQPLSGRAEYLSDRPAVEYRFTPYLSIPWPYLRDRNVVGGFLRSGGRLYLKGLGVHSAARLSYPLDGKYQKFQAALAVDDSTQGGGSVRFRVFVDGREKFTSEIVRGNQPPTPITVDLAGAKQLQLDVDYADHGDVQDHADWLNARVIRSKEKGGIKGIEIQGSEPFKSAIAKALDLLKTKAPEAYQTAADYIGIIKQGSHSGMWAYESPPALEISDHTAFRSVTWCAGSIAHDSFHSKLYLDYKKEHTGGVPDEVWIGKNAEMKCLAFQLRVLKTIGSPDDEIHYVEQLDGSYDDVNQDGKYDWEDYQKRDW